MSTCRLALAALIASLSFATVPTHGQDLDKGKEINSVCAACHGDQGQGGKHGEYPRLAGQPASYIASQLRSFRGRQRLNIPMFPYTQDRELPDEDILNISAYLASIRLSTKMPEFQGDEDALTRLQMVEQVMIVPRVDGNLDNGAQVYQEQCAYCHGKGGRGGGRYPMLVGQYTNYLTKQIASYLKAERSHDDEDSRGVLAEISAADTRDVLAYLTSIQDSASVDHVPTPGH